MVKMRVSEEEHRAINELLGIIEEDQGVGACQAMDGLFEKRKEFISQTLQWLTMLSDIEPLYAMIRDAMIRSLKKNPSAVIRYMLLAYTLYLGPKECEPLLSHIIDGINSRVKAGLIETSDEFLSKMLLEYNKLFMSEISRDSEVVAI